MRPASLTWVPPIYFLYYAAGATLLPFLAIYYQELGLKGSQIGLLAGIPPLLGLVSAPIWSAVSDITKRHKLSLLIAIGGSVLTALMLSAVKTFIWLLPVVILFAFFYSPIMPLVDSTTMSLLGSRKEQYGRIRLWGAIGWGIAAPVVGWLIESKSLLWSFWGYAILLGLGFFVAIRIPIKKPDASSSPGNISAFLTNPRWFIFLVIAFSGGMVLSMISNYLFIFLSELGANKFTLGLTLTVATLSELPVLFFSNHLLSRWNARRLMSTALLIFAVRVLAYSFIVTPWLAFFIQMLHGPTFSLMWIAGVSYADQIAPVGLEATAQGLFSGVMLGIGSAAGAFLGGVLYEQVGLVAMFRCSALVALLGVGLMLLMEKKKRETSL